MKILHRVLLFGFIAMSTGSAHADVVEFDFSDLGNNFDPAPTFQQSVNGDGFIFRATETGGDAPLFTGSQPQINFDNSGTLGGTALVQVLDSSENALNFELQNIGQVGLNGTATLEGQLNGVTVWTLDSSVHTNSNVGGVATAGEIDSIIWTVGAGDPQFGHFIRSGVTVDTITAIPEPSSIAILGLGSLGILIRRRVK